MSNGVTTVALDMMFEALLNNRRLNGERFNEAAKRYAHKVIRAYAPRLHADHYDDVIQTAFESMCKAGPVLLLSKTGTQAFRDALRTAARTLTAVHTEAGRRTRAYTRERDSAQVAAEDVGRIVGAEELQAAKDREAGSVDFDRLADPRLAEVAGRVEDKADIDKILNTAPEMVALSLRLIHLEGEDAGEVASIVGMSRFKLRRQIKAFCESCAWAA